MAQIFPGTYVHVISFYETGTIILILQIRRLKFSLDLRSDFQVLRCPHGCSIGLSSPQLQSRHIALLPRAGGDGRGDRVINRRKGYPRRPRLGGRESDQRFCMPASVPGHWDKDETNQTKISSGACILVREDREQATQLRKLYHL